MQEQKVPVDYMMTMRRYRAPQAVAYPIVGKTSDDLSHIDSMGNYHDLSHGSSYMFDKSMGTLS
jgi:hypothetical protein